jgi:hypothetical protein
MLNHRRTSDITMARVEAAYPVLLLHVQEAHDSEIRVYRTA